MAVFLSQLDRGTTDGTGCRGGTVRPAKSLYAALYLYFVMTKPSRELVVTYTRVDGDSKAVRRSYLIQTLLQLFPDIRVEELEELPARNRILTAETARDYYVDLLRQYVEEGRTEDAFLACLAWEEAKDQVTFRRLRDAAFMSTRKKDFQKPRWMLCMAHPSQRASAGWNSMPDALMRIFCVMVWGCFHVRNMPLRWQTWEISTMKPWRSIPSGF